VSYDDDHPRWSPFDRAQTAASDLRFMLSMHASKAQVCAAIGPNNYARAFEYLDSIDKNLPVLQEHIRDLIQLADRLSGALAPPDVALIERARADAGLIDRTEDGDGVTRAVHQVLIGLGGDGFRATCTCGWRSSTSGVRAVVAHERDEHKRRSQLRSVP